MTLNVLDEMFSADDDVSGTFARDELLGEFSEELLTPDDLDSDVLAELADAAASGE